MDEILVRLEKIEKLLEIQNLVQKTCSISMMQPCTWSYHSHTCTN